MTTPTATIVMYHVVHPAGRGLLARLNGIDLDRFRGQLAYIRAHYTPVSLEDLAAAVDSGSALPPRPLALTFDDGYRSQCEAALDAILAAGMTATFFPVSAALLERAVLDVNKVQLILAAAPDPQVVVDRIDAAIDRHQPALPPRGDFRERFWRPSRWDQPEVVYAKRLLQHGLPEPVRRPLVDALFDEFVSSDERDIAEQLYMNVSQVRTLKSAGMTIGAHGDRHVRLTTLTREEQALEIDGALRVLDAAGVRREGFVYSYANGEHDDHSIALLRERGCRAAVTTHPDLARIDPDHRLVLPRLDTNDLPDKSDASPSDWTRRAASEG